MTNRNPHTLERQLQMWADDLSAQTYDQRPSSHQRTPLSWTTSDADAAPTEIHLDPPHKQRRQHRHTSLVAATAAAVLLVLGFAAWNLPDRTPPSRAGDITGPPTCEGVTDTTTKGTMPPNAIGVPDFIGVAGPNGIAGYARWELLDPLQHQPQPADPSQPFPSGTTFETPPVPVCDDSLTTVVGYISSNRGFVPLGTDPESAPKLCETTVSGNADGTEERRTTC